MEAFWGFIRELRPWHSLNCLLAWLLYWKRFSYLPIPPTTTKSQPLPRPQVMTPM